MIILYENFYEEQYRLYFKEKAVLIDVGLNIGVVSLYFANYRTIEYIYSFEPFKETYEQAVYNLNLNKNLSGKITAYNFGLSDKDEEISIPYNIKYSMHMTTMQNGISNIVDPHVNKNLLKNVVKACIKSASPIISEIAQKHRGYKIIAKIDCEGSEFAIIKQLNKDGVLKLIDCILLEWHYETPDEILNALKDNGFISFAGDIKGKIGYIHCVRNN